MLPDGTYQLVGKAASQVFTFRPVLAQIDCQRYDLMQNMP